MTVLENLQAILDSVGEENVVELYREIYKRTDCGPWLSVMLHDGSMVHSDKLSGVKNSNVRGLLIGSIVEGSNAEVTGSLIDLKDFDTPEAAVERFWEELEAVNAEACRLWDEANSTYRIVRFRFQGDKEVIKTGLSLEEAQAWCERDDTHGPDWFDGYTKESKDDDEE